MRSLSIRHIIFLIVSIPVLSRPSLFSMVTATIQGGVVNIQGDDTCDSIDSKKTADELEQKVITLFDDAASLPIALLDGNIEVRTKFDGQYATTLAEAKILKRHPKVFKGFLQNFNEAFASADPMVHEVRALEQDNHREGIKVFLKFPFPLANRVMVHWKYLKMDRNPDEHLLILSEKGNQKLLDNYLTIDEKKKNALGRIFLCAYWIKPVYDVDNNVIGSTIKYVFNGDVGGALPRWVQSSIAPKNSRDSLKTFIDYGGRTLQ